MKKVYIKEVKKKSKPKITFKQKRFVEEYIKTGNATESANKVYKCKNRNVARNIGPENLAKPIIKELIEIKEEQRLKEAQDTIYILMTTSEKDEIKLKSTQDIIDRVKGKAKQVSEYQGKDGGPIEIKSILDELIKGTGKKN